MNTGRDDQKYMTNGKQKHGSHTYLKIKGEYIAENFGPASSCGRHKQC